jgi:hypothetical protein
MLEGFRFKVGLSYSRLHFRKNRDRIMNFTDALTRSHRALVILPDPSLDNESTSALFRFLLRKFSSDEMMVLLRDDQLRAMSTTPPLKTLVYSSEDINPWYIPRRDLLKKMETHSFDVAFDLNFDLSLPSAFLCKASNAPLRVSFAKQNGDQFYNFQVKTRGAAVNSSSYRSLLKCIDMF